MHPKTALEKAPCIEMRPFGNTEMRVSALGFGTAEIGFENTPDHTIDRILGEALDKGLNVIDTAPMYADSEEKLGRALRGRRERFLLFTKCGRHLQPRNSFPGFLARVDRQLRRIVRQEDGRDSADWRPLALRKNIETSLTRLKTERLDLLQLHSCSEKMLRRGDIFEVLESARRSGKVRYIGYSGDGQAALYAVRSGRFDALQISINVADQEALELIMPLAHQKNIGIIAKRPIASAVWRKTRKPVALEHHAYWERLQKLQYDFFRGHRDFETALRFTMSVPGVSTTIVGTADLAHFSQNLTFAQYGGLDPHQFEGIRTRWKQVAQADWVGQM